MPHIESSVQAVQRLEDASERHARTVRRTKNDGRRRAHAEHHYTATVRNARQQVRYVSGLANVEQAILGTAGSPEQLKKYQDLAKELGKQAGQPLVAVETFGDGGHRVEQAVVGEIDGSLEAWADFLDRTPASVTDPHQTATLCIPANGLTRFSRIGEDWIPSRANGLGSRVKAADIILDEAGFNPTHDPERDFAVYDEIDQGRLFLGEEAIQASGLFEPDFKNILEIAGLPV